MSWDSLGVEVTSEREFLGRATWAALRLILLVLSAITSAAFFGEYAGGLFTWLVGPEMAPYMAAAVGALTLDGGAMAWAYLRQKHADTLGQMSIAGVMSIADLTASLIVTVLYLLLRGGLALGVYDAAGALTSLGRGLHVLGALVITIGIAANFGAAFAYAHFGAGARKAAQERQLESLAAAARFAADRRRLELVTQQALQAIYSQLPDLAQQQGGAAAGDYLAHTMPAARGIPAAANGAPEGSRAMPAAMPEDQPDRPFVNGSQAGG